MALKMVFEPLRVDSVKLPNRIARTAYAAGIGGDRITDAA